MDRDAKIALFLSAFRGRTDVHAQHVPDQGGYRPVSSRLDETRAKLHLTGLQILGVYPLLPDNTTWFLAVDFDRDGAWEDALAVGRACLLREVPAYLERSRSGVGVHVWIFFSAPLPAYKARDLGRLLEAESRGSLDRFFPRQDRHKGKGVGNLIALPMQRHARDRGCTDLLDERGQAWDDPWLPLQTLRRVDERTVDFSSRKGPAACTVPCRSRASPPSHPWCARLKALCESTSASTSQSRMPPVLRRWSRS